MWSHYYGLIPGLLNAQQNNLRHRRHIATIRDSVRWTIGADEGYCAGGTARPDDGTLSCPRNAHLSHTTLHYGLPLLPTTSNGHPAQKNLWTFEYNIRERYEMKSVDNSEMKPVVDSSEIKSADSMKRKL